MLQQDLFTKDKILSAADKHNMKMKQKFRSFFDGNKAFYKEFVFEAMTGKVKFDDNEGTATHFLVVDFDGDGHLENVITSADAYVSKILPRVNPEVRFKSSAQTKKKTGKTGFYNFRSVVQLSYTAQSKAVKEYMIWSILVNFNTYQKDFLMQLKERGIKQRHL